MSDKDTAAKQAARTKADIEFIEALAKLLRDNDLAEIEVNREYGDDDELTVRLARTYSAAPVAYAPPPSFAAPAALAPVAAPVAAASPQSTTAPEAAPADHPGAVTSPMVGTVYLAPEPSAGNFVEVGAQVTEGQTVLIVEAMKTMNQIPSPKAGTVKQILVQNEDPVEYGAVLMIIE